ncbi:MAG: hypothetical protein P4M11_08775, partial [Candidatus Pacebacteria bacterium]|nr:hypothetical protein [Candidatus Paceibacterota bacterium]
MNCLCSYHKRHNKHASMSYLTIALSLITTQVLIASTICMLFWPWKHWADLIRLWLALDVPVILCAYISGIIRREALIAENRQRLEFQLQCKSMLQICVLLPTAIFGLVPLMLPKIDKITELSAIMWVSGCIVQLNLCVWVADGLWYKLFLMVTYNTCYCLLCNFKGFFKFATTVKLIVPIFHSLVFIISMDRYTKSNFVLKKTLKHQKRMYERHLEKVQDPVAILDRERMLFYN